MSKFRELYYADIARYGGKEELYIKKFHYLHRKAETATLVLVRLFYKALFRMWASHRGLEILTNQRIGGFI